MPLCTTRIAEGFSENLSSFSSGCRFRPPVAYSLFEAFAAGICLFAEREALMRTIYARAPVRCRGIFFSRRASDSPHVKTGRGRRMNVVAASRREPPEALFATPDIVAERRADGSIWLRSMTPLQPAARCTGDWLEHWARQAPERIFLGERSSVDAPWTTVTYKDALRQVRSVGGWILSQSMSAQRPLVILSDNSIEHALFALGAMHVGVPVASISPAYSLMSKDFDKLKGMITLLDPGAIYVSSLKAFAPALAAIKPLHAATVVSGDAESG